MENTYQAEQSNTSDFDAIELTFTDIDVQLAVEGLARRC